MKIMLRTILTLTIGLTICSLCFPQITFAPVDKGGLDNEAEVARGWGIGSAQNDKYEIIFSNVVFPGDSNISTIKSKTDDNEASGAIYHCISLKKYKGQRVRMTAWAKTREVKEAGFWFFCRSDTNLVLDNSSAKGTTEWTNYSMVIDVMPYTYLGTCGVFLDGTGEINFKNINFEIVDSSVPVTAQARKKD